MLTCVRKDLSFSADGKMTPLDFMLETLHTAAVVNGDSVDHHPGLTMVLSYKIDINTRDLKDRTPLIRMVKAGHFKFVKKLVEHGAEVNCEIIREKFSASPFTIAV